MKSHYLVLLCVMLTLAACGAEPTPAPDLVATQIAVEEAAHATMTARAPTATPMPVPTRTNTATLRPSATTKPTVTPTSAVGQRSNPVPFGTLKDLVMDGDQQFSITVTQSFRGSEAWSRIEKANKFNDQPPPGMEYALFYLQGAYSSGPADSVLALNWTNFDMVSKGQIIEYESVIVPDPAFDINLFPGASAGGWLAWNVYLDDPQPLLAAGMDYDKTGGFFFSLSAAAASPTNTPAASGQVLRWERFESAEWGIAFDYPPGMTIQEQDTSGYLILDTDPKITGWRVLSPDGQLFDIYVLCPESGVGDKAAEFRAQAMVSNFLPEEGVEKTWSDCTLGPAQELSGYGNPAALVSCQSNDSAWGAESFVIQGAECALQSGFFSFTKSGDLPEEWSAQVIESISFSLP